MTVFKYSTQFRLPEALILTLDAMVAERQKTDKRFSRNTLVNEALEKIAVNWQMGDNLP